MLPWSPNGAKCKSWLHLLKARIHSFPHFLMVARGQMSGSVWFDSFYLLFNITEITETVCTLLVWWLIIDEWGWLCICGAFTSNMRLHSIVFRWYSLYIDWGERSFTFSHCKVFQYVSVSITAWQAAVPIASCFAFCPLLPRLATNLVETKLQEISQRLGIYS